MLHKSQSGIFELALSTSICLMASPVRLACTMGIDSLPLPSASVVSPTPSRQKVKPNLLDRRLDALSGRSTEAKTSQWIRGRARSGSVAKT